MSEKRNSVQVTTHLDVTLSTTPSRKKVRESFAKNCEGRH